MIEVQNLTKKFDGKVNKSYLFAVKKERKNERAKRALPRPQGVCRNRSR